MKTIQAHVFQHKFTGIEVFIYHCNSKQRAQEMLNTSVYNSKDFIYLSIKEVLV